MSDLLTPREAATVLGISYPTVKQWIYKRKLRTARPPAATIAFAKRSRQVSAEDARKARHEAPLQFPSFDGRNRLIGRIVDLKVTACWRR